MYSLSIVYCFTSQTKNIQNTTDFSLASILHQVFTLSVDGLLSTNPTRWCRRPDYPLCFPSFVFPSSSVSHQSQFLCNSFLTLCPSHLIFNPTYSTRGVSQQPPEFLLRAPGNLMSLGRCQPHGLAQLVMWEFLFWRDKLRAETLLK